MEHYPNIRIMDHIEIGQWGEDIACRYLENKGYRILDRNFRRKWGEIDIVCGVPRGTIIFVEVKTLRPGSIRPEENVTPSKQRKLIRSCQLYLSQKNYSNNTDWQIDVIAILLDKNTGKTTVEHIEQAVYY